MGKVEFTDIAEKFVKLTTFDSESFHEKEIGTYIVEELRKIGAQITLDIASEYKSLHPESFGNIYAKIPGNIDGEAILFSSHLDTVSPGNNKKAFLHNDGKITSDGNTVLGADDISGLVAIIEGCKHIINNNIDHPDIELLLTVAEEPFCEGSKYFNYDLLESKKGYVLDLTGPIGTAATSAPSIISFEVEIEGKASHAGFAPEEGVNALQIAVDAIKNLKLGRIDDNTTANIGLISGGTGRNIVPASIKLSGEVRSFDHIKATKIVKDIIESFEKVAKKAGGKAIGKSIEHIKAYNVDIASDVIKHFEKAVNNVEGIDMSLVSTLGGSDGNRLNEHGIETIVLACGMEKVHTVEEYTYVSELEKVANLVISLITTV